MKTNMKTKVYQYLVDFGSITTWEAIQQLGCTRLSEYIRQIRLEHQVNSEWITSTNRYGEPVWFKKYSLGE